jgi:hypothetical protein
MTRNGKIARWPAAIRTELKQRLFDGEQGQPLEEKGAENDARTERTKNQATSWSRPRFLRVEKPGTNVARPPFSLTQFKQI